MKKQLSFVLATAMLLLIAAPIEASSNANTNVFNGKQNSTATMFLEEIPLLPENPYPMDNHDNDFHKDKNSETTYNNLEEGFPTFIVLDVDRGLSITVKTRYFPANERWAIFLKDGAMDAEKLYEVKGFTSGISGVNTLTITIPSELQYKDTIAVIFYCLSDNFRTYDLVLNRECKYPNCTYLNIPIERPIN